MWRPEALVIDDSGRMEAAAATWIAMAMEASIRQRGRCSLALAGGATPRPVYERLAAEPLSERVPWNRVAVYFGDERCVPPDDGASNFRMANEALLSRIPIPPSQIHRMEAERPDREASARAYERLLPDRFDLLLLGMGPDGHTASLFPHSPATTERIRRVVPVTSPHPPACRLTITPPVIRRARTIGVIVAGAEKATTLARVLEGPSVPEELPVQLAADGFWFVDRAAARRLEHGVV
ncbi:MAG: 6-phosphogluconolactonase [Gemmatimonadales bacterium]